MIQIVFLHMHIIEHFIWQRPGASHLSVPEYTSSDICRSGPTTYSLLCWESFGITAAIDSEGEGFIHIQYLISYLSCGSAT